MKNKFAAFILLLSTVFALVSCLNADNDYTYTDDSAITSFSISSGKQYVHVISSTGGDSIVTNELTLSGYKFYIDQVNCVIYNPDSLPCGTDAKKLLCSVSAKNSGTVLIKSMTSDSLAYVSTTDSTDFSADRQLQVYSNSGQGVRKYTVKVNVHKEFPDSFAWHSVPECETMKRFTAVKAVAVSGGILLFGTDGNNTLVMRGGDNGWTVCAPNFNHVLAADAYRGVVTKDGRAYISDAGNIICTADGDLWDQTGTATGITRLVAASRFCIYGYAADGRLMASSDDGKTWNASDIDDAQTLLPTGETAYTAYPIPTNDFTDRVLLIGMRDRSLYPADNTLTVWGRIDEGAEGSESQPWAYYNVAEENKHKAPVLSSISALIYDGAVIVFGAKDGEAPTVYKTLDNGITWNADTTKLIMPNNFSEGLEVAAQRQVCALAVDKNNVLWLVNALNGKTWRGRINRLGWSTEQTEFDR